MRKSTGISGENKLTDTKVLAMLAIYVAVGVIGSVLISIPLGIARAFPVQHMINVIIICTLGTKPALFAALATATTRIATGTGSLLAIPGSLIGAALGGYLYHRTGKKSAAVIGEIIGTGIIAPIVSVPYAAQFMGKEVAIIALLPGFLASSALGAAIAYYILKSKLEKYLLP